MNAYTHIFTHTCTHTHTHAYIYIYMHKYTCIATHIHTYVYIHTHTHYSIQTYIHTYVCLCIYWWEQTVVILALCQRDHNDSLSFFSFFLSSLIRQLSDRAPTTNPLASLIYFLIWQNPFPIALSRNTSFRELHRDVPKIQSGYVGLFKVRRKIKLMDNIYILLALLHKICPSHWFHNVIWHLIFR
jgi:hypothetical protein